MHFISNFYLIGGSIRFLVKAIEIVDFHREGVGKLAL